MRQSNHQPISAVLTLLMLAALACALPQTSGGTPLAASATLPAYPTSITPGVTQQTSAIPSPTLRPTPAPEVAEHRIGTHLIYGIAEFYDRQGMTHFIPRGVNYAILVPVLDHYENRLFAAGFYDHKRTQADFASLAAAGYNTVRIVVDGCTSGDSCIGVANGQGMNLAYLDNIADLMSVAKENHLFLLMASQGLPDLGGYATAGNRESGTLFAPYRNSQLLTRAGIDATKLYWADLLVGLAIRQAPFDVILGWELLDEGYYEYDKPPFSLREGTVTPANGKTYDMYMLAQKQALATDSMRYYINQVRQTIITYDPTALVTMGLIAPDKPNEWREGDNRYLVTGDLLSLSTLDFFDLHTDPGVGLSMDEAVQNFGLGAHVSKPVVMGEVGASTWAYPQATTGAIAVQDWIAASCDKGFSGWLYSNYYPSPAGLADVDWGCVDEHGALLNALAPVNQPDACVVGVLPGRNLALGKAVIATEELPDQTAIMAVDGDPGTQWSAGAFPSQWIEIDLGSAYSIGEIRLTVGMWPAGEAIHQLWVGADRKQMKLVHEFSGEMADYDVLSYLPASPLLNIRYVRIVTTESPSWVSWREIEVVAPLPATPTPTVTVTP